MLTALLLALGVGYVLGAIPFGYLVARAKGVNIFEVGSKNPGATNVLRTLGKGPGYLTFFFDALKGALAVSWMLMAAKWGCTPIMQAGAEGLVYAQVLGMFAALIGHSFSCFTGFKGGKGVATVAGAFVVLSPLATLVALVSWVLTFYTTKYVSLASIVSAVALSMATWFSRAPLAVCILVTVVAVLVIARHHANIRRLLNGTENRFGRKQDQPKAP